MKRLAFLIILLMLALAACAPEGWTYSPSQTQSLAASTAPSPSPADSPAPTKEPAPKPTQKPAPEPTIKATPTPEPEPAYAPAFEGFVDPEESTVILAGSDGKVYFGYTNGRWLTHSQAAAYCGQKMKFYETGVEGTNGYVTSSGAAEYTGDLAEASYAINGEDVINDENIIYHLKLSRSSDSMLCSIDAARVPKATPLKDTSAVLPPLQALADRHFGAGKVVVRITSAVSVDIDGDGKKETVVNASNNEHGRYDFLDEAPGYWYSISCAIKEDGSYAFLEECYEYGFKSDDSRFVAVRGVLDIDGDGVCEFIIYSEAWEYWGMFICKLDNANLTAMAGYEFYS